MKKRLITGATLVSIIIMAIFFVIPAFAQENTGATPTNIQQFDENGDYRAVIEGFKNWMQSIQH